MRLNFHAGALVLLFMSGVALTDGNNRNSLQPPQAVSEKKAAIKLYPNPSTNGTVRILSNTAGPINFYIFELDGTLRHQAVIDERGKHTVTGLTKGVYTYDVFYKDEGIEHGKLIVK